MTNTNNLNPSTVPGEPSRTRAAEQTLREGIAAPGRLDSGTTDQRAAATLDLVMSHPHMRPSVVTLVQGSLSNYGDQRHAAYRSQITRRIERRLTGQIEEVRTSRDKVTLSLLLTVMPRDLDEMGQMADPVGFIAARLAASLLQAAGMPIIADHVRANTMAVPPELWDDTPDRQQRMMAAAGTELRRNIEL